MKAVWHFSVQHFLAGGKEALQCIQSMREALWLVNPYLGMSVCAGLDGVELIFFTVPSNRWEAVN